MATPNEAAIMKALRSARGVIALRFGDDPQGGAPDGKGKKGNAPKAAPPRPIVIIVIGKGGKCIRHEREHETVYICGGTGWT